MPVNQERFGLSQRWEKNNEIGEVIVVRREREKRNADVNNFEKKIHLTSCPFFMVHTPRENYYILNNLFAESSRSVFTMEKNNLFVIIIPKFIYIPTYRQTTTIPHATYGLTI